jgi:glycosyltransferase involved in cell wall biosynthesis
MLEKLSARSQVEIFDRTPRGRSALHRAVNQMLPPFRFLVLCLRNRDMPLYLALSGGLGQIFDSLYVLSAYALGLPMFIHHHSFAYLNSPSLLNRAFFALTRRHVHVVLSAGMAERLAQTYGIPPERVRALSNAAFFDLEESPAGSPADQGTGDSSPAASDCAPLRLGYLSNITLEKGIREFFAVLDLLRAHGVAYRATVAGPIDPSAAGEFAGLLAASVDVEYVGPVFDTAKRAFYRDLDLFLFPSRYVNEAEPLVVLEALQSSVYVLASDRGAISEMVANGAGWAFSEASFVEQATREIRTLDHDRARLRQVRLLALEQSRRLRTAAQIELEATLDAIAGPG